LAAPLAEPVRSEVLRRESNTPVASRH